MSKGRIQGIRKTTVSNLTMNVTALCIAVIFLFPLYWILVSSFKTDAEILSNTLKLWPKSFHIANYTSQLKGSNSLLHTLPNSVITAVSNMLISIVLAVPAAYGIARFNMWGKRGVILIFLTTQMLPASLILTPLFLTYSKVGLLNTLLGPILAIATISIPFTVVVLRPIFQGCPKELEEAAIIDGCNRFTAFIRVVLPVSKTGLVTVGCFSFVHGWNNLIYNMTFNTSAKFRTMPSGIYTLMNEYGTQWNRIMAYGVILVTPVVILFILAQKYIVGGLTSGAVKQ